MKSPRFSIVIPTHDMKGKTNFLHRTFDALWNQTLQDFEIIVTDNSEDDKIKQICEYYGSIQYYRNPRKGMAQNTNEGIKLAKGQLIKILYLDDYLAHNKALEKIWINFQGEWLVTGCEHSDGINRFSPHLPKYNQRIQFGDNTIGSPSVLTIRNNNPLLFDEEMTWLLDTDLYKRYCDKYGLPTILNDINVVIGVGDHQLTHLMGDERKAKEQEYINKKYA